MQAVLAILRSPVNVAREARQVRLQKMQLRRVTCAQSAGAPAAPGQRSMRSVLEIPRRLFIASLALSLSMSEATVQPDHFYPF